MIGDRENYEISRVKLPLEAVHLTNWFGAPLTYLLAAVRDSMELGKAPLTRRVIQEISLPCTAKVHRGALQVDQCRFILANSQKFLVELDEEKQAVG